MANFPCIRPGETIVQEFAEPQPSFTVVFPAYGGEKTGQVEVPWVKGKALKQYIREQPLKQYHIISKLQTHKFYNAERECVKQYYMPAPGDSIVLIPVKR